jgi:hypothetical protein
MYLQIKQRRIALQKHRRVTRRGYPKKIQKKERKAILTPLV